MKKITIITLLISAFYINAKTISDTDKLYQNCGFDKKSMALAKLLIESKDQKRQKLSCNIKLTEAAQKKAQMMSETEYISHNLFHTSPNELLRNQGAELPNYYKKMGNQVETILGGAETAKDSLIFFMEDPEYRVHIFGGNELTLEQDQIGVGYYEDTNKRHRYYWAVYISALKKEDETHQVKLQVNPSIISHDPVKHSQNKKKKVDFPNQLYLKSQISTNKERERREEKSNNN